MTIDLRALANELTDAYRDRRTDVAPPSSRGGMFDLAAAYAVGADLRQRRFDSGRTLVGRKVGYANKAMWRVLKLDTLVWAPMYDDTVVHAANDAATLSVERMAAPRIEPEIVFRLKSAPPADAALDAAGALQHVDWLALGFEIIDCVYEGWQFQPTDFVAASGLHAGLVVGSPLVVSEADVAQLVEQLASFTVQLARGGEVVATGSGRNSLRSPALCLAALASAAARQPGEEPLAAGELVSSGTLTESQPIAPGQTWTASVAGISLPPLVLTL